jgi:hypothetical protein
MINLRRLSSIAEGRRPPSAAKSISTSGSYLLPLLLFVLVANVAQFFDVVCHYSMLKINKLKYAGFRQWRRAKSFGNN